MNEYDYGEYEGSQSQSTFLNEDQETFWRAFSDGAVNDEERSFFTGNPQAILAYMSIEREREGTYNNDREI